MSQSAPLKLRSLLYSNAFSYLSICDQFCYESAHQEIVLILVQSKVKVTLVQALRLYTGLTARRGSRGLALLFHDNGTRRR